MIKTIAMYLPQFHCFPENDTWWGKGFTEWTNVKAAKPLYNNHLQPRVPLDGEYYDLSEEAVLVKQMQMAKEYGVDGFCFYHYWFNGKKLLEKPVEKLLSMDNIILPFCFCWANEPWTRNWDGLTNAKEILMPQEYGQEEEWKEHFEYLNRFFSKEQYIKKDNKPVFIIYKASDIKEREKMINYWNKLAKKEGYAGIYIINVHRANANREIPIVGDAVMDFEPFATLARAKMTGLQGMIKQYEGNNGKTYEVIDYENFCEYMVSRYIFKGMNHYLGFFAGWDNTPRRRDNTEIIFENNTPEVFQKYFKMQYERSIEACNDFIFINAWNEWGEGTFLEPDERYRFGYLEAIKRVKGSNV